MSIDDVVVLATAPGHLLRRAQQIHTDSWARLVPCVTGPQYAVLVVVEGWGGIDQKTAGELASLDKSTIAGVVARLAHSGWLERAPDVNDRRRRLLRLTEYARTRLPELGEATHAVQDELLVSLKPEVRCRFVDQLATVARVAELPVHEKSRSVRDLHLARTPGYLLRRAQQCHTSLWAAAVPDLTGPQYAVLSALSVHRVATYAEIGSFASLDSSNTLDVVRRISARGWLEPVPSIVDRRSRPVALTASARTALRLLGPAVESVQTRILEPLDRSEHDTFVSDLQAVARIYDQRASKRTAPRSAVRSRWEVLRAPPTV